MTLREILVMSIGGAEKRVTEITKRLEEKHWHEVERTKMKAQRLRATTEIAAWKDQLAAMDAAEKREAS